MNYVPPPLQTYSHAMGPDPSIRPKDKIVGGSKPPTKTNVVSGPRPFEAPESLQRPRNGANSPDGFGIDHVRGRDGGNRVSDPFSPEWHKPEA